MNGETEIVRVDDAATAGVRRVADRMKLSDTDAALLVLRMGLHAFERQWCGADDVLQRLAAGSRPGRAADQRQGTLPLPAQPHEASR